MLVTTTFIALASLLGVVPLLLLFGHRLKWSSAPVSGLAVVVWAFIAGEVGGRVFDLPSSYVLVATAVLAGVSLVVVWARPLWNPIGHLFFSALIVAGFSYLGLATKATFAAGLSTVGVVASALLLAFEIFAIILALSFAFESVDVGCRSRWRRQPRPPDPEHLPFVSLQVPAYNEPPEMLIDTIRSLEAMDYPHFEIVVIDNNTQDEDVWRPVADYCAGRPGVTFVHVAPWPGFKSGALNLVLREHMDPRTEVIGVVDADYIVQPDYLRSLVGHFADPEVAFVQTPQDYREYEGDRYLTACYDSYKYFFETAMPSRNDRNSIIFGGTMGLIRRSVLEDLGGWDEWCITEDAESSLRMLRAGHSGIYVNESFGRGIMPLTFTSLKKQRFRWCFGGVQILRKHWRSLMPWDRSPANRLSIPQRIDYLIGGVQWFSDLAGLAFAAIVVISAAVVITTGEIALRALTGALILVPAALIGSGFVRAMWALRALTGISTGRAILAFATWLALSWTTALACIRGIVRRDGVFLRTPKWHRGGHLIEALRETRVETAFALVLASVAAALVIAGGPLLLAGLAAWQSVVFACAPSMAWLNQRTELTARLDRRARSEDRRDRIGAIPPFAVRSGVLGAAAVALVAVLVIGGSDRSGDQADVFDKPERGGDDEGFFDADRPDDRDADGPATTTSPSSTTSVGDADGSGRTSSTTAPPPATAGDGTGTPTTSGTVTPTTTATSTATSTPAASTSTAAPTSTPAPTSTTRDTSPPTSQTPPSRPAGP